MTSSSTTPTEASAPDGEPPKSGLALRAGLVLIVASNGVYPLYFLLPFLSVDAIEMTGLAAGFSLASWGIFALGVALAGPDGVTMLRQVLRRLVCR